MNLFSIVIIFLLVICLLFLCSCGFLPTPLPVPSTFVQVDKTKDDKTILHSPTCFRFKGKLYVLGGYLQKSKIPTHYVQKMFPFQEISGMQYRSKKILNKRMYEVTDEEKAFIIENRIRQHEIENKEVEFAIDPTTWREFGSISSSKVIRDSSYYLEFKGNMYVVGGVGHDVGTYYLTGTKYSNSWIDIENADVWKSSDLKNWKQIAKEVPWSKSKNCREGHKIVATAESMYLTGGTGMALDGEQKQVNFKDTWESQDGKTWKKQTGMLHSLVGNQTLKSNGKYFHIGNQSKTLYTSDDGINWQSRLDASHIIDRSAVLGILNNKITISISSEDKNDSINNLHDVYFLTDGLEWQHSQTGEFKSFSHFGIELTDIDYGPFGGFNLVEFNNALLLIGLNSDRFYKTTDGLSWEKMNLQKPLFQSRTGAAIGVFNNFLWIMGGAWNDSVTLGDIWKSSDGLKWELVTGDAPWGTSRSSNIFVSRGRLYLVKHGVQWDMHKGVVGHPREIWSTTDCVTWRKETGKDNNVFIEASNLEDIDRAIKTKEALYFLDCQQHKLFLKDHSGDTIQATFFLDNFSTPNIAEVREKGKRPVFVVQKPNTFWTSYDLHNWGHCELEINSDRDETIKNLFYTDWTVRKPVYFKNKLLVVGVDFLNNHVYSAEVALGVANSTIKVLHPPISSLMQPM